MRPRNTDSAAGFPHIGEEQKKRAACSYRPAKIKRSLSINLSGQNL